MNAFVLTVQDISPSGKSYEFELDPVWMSSAFAGSDLRVDPAAPCGSIAITAQRSGADVVVQGRLSTRYFGTCVRCLGDAVIDVDAPVTALFCARGAELRPEPDELELTPEDLDRGFFSGDEIVLDPFIRELLLLECPMQPLCAEDCGGIALPAHLRSDDRMLGKDGEPVDPRLLPLLKLSRELAQNEE